MRVSIECFPCFLKQVHIAMRQAGIEGDLQFEIMKEASTMLSSIDRTLTPAHFTTYMHRWIRQRISRDPFEQVKRQYNQVSLGLYDYLKDTVYKSTDPLNTAVRLAIAGNIIDFGIFTSVDIKGTISRAINSELTIDRFEQFKTAVDNVKEILYLTDNTGEIVFDRVLIELLVDMGKKITAVVKGADVLNDATMQDAIDVGLTKVCRVIDNGSDCIGTILDRTSEDFIQQFSSSKLIISKGQGNFETLHDYSGHEVDIFFLFQSKCDALSNMLKLPKGSMLLSYSKMDYRVL